MDPGLDNNSRQAVANRFTKRYGAEGGQLLARLQQNVDATNKSEGTRLRLTFDDKTGDLFLHGEVKKTKTIDLIPDESKNYWELRADGKQGLLETPTRIRDCRNPAVPDADN